MVRLEKLEKPELEGLPPHVIEYIGNLETRYRELERTRYTDDLTNLFSRNGFLSEMGKSINSTLRHKSDVLGVKNMSAGMVDVDGLKNINDKYGHATGDLVLTSIAKNGRNSVRHVDIIGRYGGDEFGLGLPDIDESGAKAIIERWRQLQENSPVSGSLTATISIGIADLASAPEISYLRGSKIGNNRGIEAIQSLFDYGIENEKTWRFIVNLYQFMEYPDKERFNPQKMKEALATLAERSGNFLQQNGHQGSILDYIKDSDFRWQFASYLLLQRADEALYKAKNMGRNRILTYSETQKVVQPFP